MSKFKPIEAQELKKGQTVDLEIKVNGYSNNVQAKVTNIHASLDGRERVQYDILEYPVYYQPRKIVYIYRDK